MKNLNKMDIFKLSAYKTILNDLKENLKKTLVNNNINAIIDESTISNEDKEIIAKYNILQTKIDEINKLIEKKIFNNEEI